MVHLLVLSTLLLTPPDESAEVGPPNVSPSQFLTWFDAAREGRMAIPDEVGRNARRFRYVFVNGLDIGLPQGCFAQNVKELRAQGVPETAIHLVDPSSRKTVDENAATMERELKEIAARGPEPLVLIAHSRGACDTLAFALRHPRFVSDRVRAIFLVQGPFGGSGAADYAAGEGSPIDRRMPPAYRLGARVVGKLEARLLDRDRHEVITSLSRNASEKFWRELTQAHAEALPIVGPRVFYVTSHTRPSHHPVLQRVTAWYVHTYYGPSDGLIALEDQSLTGLGTVLAVLDAGHTDLTHRFPSARPQKKLRQALVDAILMSVGTSGTTAEADSETPIPTSYRVDDPPARRRGRRR